MDIGSFGLRGVAKNRREGFTNRRILNDGFDVGLGSFGFFVSLLDCVFNTRKITMGLLKDFANAAFASHPDTNWTIDEIGKVVGSLDVGGVEHGNV